MALALLVAVTCCCAPITLAATAVPHHRHVGPATIAHGPPVTTSPTPPAIVAAPTTPTVTTFSSIALSSTPLTDKIRHGYGDLYDAYLTSTLQSSPIKLLEIGLGCDMAYGPGASSKIWPVLFPHADIWLADSNADCVERYWSDALGWKYLIGDQSNVTTLRSWINATGTTPFHIIVDDGGHRNTQIWTAFEYLFAHALAPGGVYFIEDLHVNKAEPWFEGGVHHSLAVVDILQDWMQQLVLRSFRHAYSGMNATERSALGLNYKTRVPDDVSRIDCVQDMCAVTKKRKG